MQQIKLLMVMKMLKEDAAPIEIMDHLYIGSIAAAYSNKALEKCTILVKVQHKSKIFSLFVIHHSNYLIIITSKSMYPILSIKKLMIILEQLVSSYMNQEWINKMYLFTGIS